MAALRLLILAASVALGTVVAGWWSVPLVAAAYGVASRRTHRPGRTAAAAGALAWGGYLTVTALTGAPVWALATRLAVSMQLPSWGLFVATLVFPAVLAGLASYLGARVGSHYLSAP